MLTSIELPYEKPQHAINVKMTGVDLLARRGRPYVSSALDSFISSDLQARSIPCDPAYLHLAQQVLHNLRHQHDWTDLTIHTHSPLLPDVPLSRPLVSGLPPHRIYIHPDEQIELLKARIADKDVPAEHEWILPSHLREKWTLRRFGELFDAIGANPPRSAEDDNKPGAEPRSDGQWRKVKRALLATVDDDSTIVYYVVHDGIVKPRQN